MRHQQGFDAYQIFKEYEILGSVLYHFLGSVVDEIPLPCTREELLACGRRVFEAVALIQQAMAMQFLRRSQARVRDRENRLRGFNRMVSHELKNRVGAAKGAVAMLSESWLDEPERQRFLRMSAENLEGIHKVLDDLIAVSRLDENLRQQRNVRLSESVAEVRRHLREFARSRDVTVDVENPLPPIEVNAAAIELCLTNYISNAIKYSDPAKTERWVRVRARLVDPTDGGDRGDRGELVVEVVDNGLGIPPETRTHLFERFFRDTRTSMARWRGWDWVSASCVRRWKTWEDASGPDRATPACRSSRSRSRPPAAVNRSERPRTRRPLFQETLDPRRLRAEG